MERSDLSLEGAITKFVSYLKAQKRSNNTVIAYQGDLMQLSRFLKGLGVDSLDKIVADQFEQFKASLAKDNYTAKSISRKLNSIKSLFGFLLDEGVIERDPSRTVKHPKIVNDAPRLLQPLEYRALRDGCRHDKRTLAVVELMLQAGLRISEVANLQIDDVKDEYLVIRAYESHPERKVPLNRAAKEAVADYLAKERYETKSRYVFVTKSGRPLLVRNIRSILNRYFEKANLGGIKVNDLRNTFIVEQLSAGVPLDVISRIVGHKRLSTTERYLILVKKTGDEGFRLKEL